MTDQIIKMYTEDNLSLTSISKSTNIGRGVVTRILLENGIQIERKPRSDMDKTGVVQYNKKFYNYQRGAVRRNYSFELTREQFEERINGNCVYCGQEPNMKFTNSPNRVRAQFITINTIDRVDNQLGYTYDNTVSCCNTCNTMKSDLSYSQFINHINRISNHVRL